MKKFLLIGLIVALGLIVVGGTGVVFARVGGIDDKVANRENTTQNGDETNDQFGYCPGGMVDEDVNGSCPGGYQGENENGYRRGGMMGQNGKGYGPGGMMGGYGKGYGPGGMMGGYGNGYGPGSMMGGRGNGYGPGMMAGLGMGVMHDYMVSAFAEAVGLNPTDVETRLSNGETLTQIATAQGITQDQLPDLITQVRQAALDQAVAADVITQAQADKMLERMNEYNGQGFGPGYGMGDCPMFDGDEAQQP